MDELTGDTEKRKTGDRRLRGCGFGADGNGSSGAKRRMIVARGTRGAPFAHRVRKSTECKVPAPPHDTQPDGRRFWSYSAAAAFTRDALALNRLYGKKRAFQLGYSGAAYPFMTSRLRCSELLMDQLGGYYFRIEGLE